MEKVTNHIRKYIPLYIIIILAILAGHLIIINHLAFSNISNHYSSDIQKRIEILEYLRDSYSNNIQFFSILITAIFVVAGFLLYRFNSLDNKNTKEEIQKDHKRLKIQIKNKISDNFKSIEIIKNELIEFQKGVYPLHLNVRDLFSYNLKGANHFRFISNELAFIINGFYYLNLIKSDEEKYYLFWRKTIIDRILNLINYNKEFIIDRSIEFDIMDLIVVNHNIIEVLKFNTDIVDQYKIELYEMKEYFEKLSINQTNI